MLEYDFTPEFIDEVVRRFLVGEQIADIADDTYNPAEDIKGGYACGEYEWKCSVCGETDWRGSADWMKFCMYCGAKMDGSEEE